MTREGTHAAELGERSRQLAARLALLELGDRLLEPGCRLLQPPLGDVGVGERRAGPGGGAGVARLRIDRQRALELFACLGRSVRPNGESAGLLEQRSRGARLAGQRRGLLVVAPA